MDATTLKLLRRLVNFGYGLGFIPYQFKKPRWNLKRKSKPELDEKSKGESESQSNDESEGREIFIFNDSPRRLHFLYFLFTITALYEIFLVVQTVQVFSDKKVKVVNKFRLLSFTYTYIFINNFHAVTIYFYGEHAKYCYDQK